MPPTYQGTKFREGSSPVLYLNPDQPIGKARQRAKLALIQELNRRHHELRQEDSELEARIATYDLAYRMQSSAPSPANFAQDTPATPRLFLLPHQHTPPLRSPT